MNASSSLPHRLASSETSAERLELVREMETAASTTPSDRSADFSRHLVPLFTSPTPSIRRHALQAAVASLAANPKDAPQVLLGYQTALLSSNGDVAKQAISFLPQMVAVAKDQCGPLIRAALSAGRRHAGPTDLGAHVAAAMEVIRDSAAAVKE